MYLKPFDWLVHVIHSIYVIMEIIPVFGLVQARCLREGEGTRGVLENRDLSLMSGPSIPAHL